MQKKSTRSPPPGIENLIHIPRVREPIARIFLSHPHAEGKAAVAFAQWLEDVFSLEIEVICTSQPEHHIASGMVTTKLIEHVKSASVVLCLISPHTLTLPWLFYEMGAGQALEKLFVPCAIRSLRLNELPPQAIEYMGVEISSTKDLEKLVFELSSRLNGRMAGLMGIEKIAKSFR